MIDKVLSAVPKYRFKKHENGLQQPFY